MKPIAICLVLISGCFFAPATLQAADAPTPKGFFSFGPDETITDIDQVEWQPLRLEGLPPGIEIASLRGDLAKGGGEILLRVPANYTVPNHSHVSDELYLWLKGAFTYIAADGKQSRSKGRRISAFQATHRTRSNAMMSRASFMSAIAGHLTCTSTRCLNSWCGAGFA